MNGNIYKVVDSITKEEILQNCEYCDISDYGDVMTYEDFMVCVDCHAITSYNGSGCVVLFDKEVKNTGLWISNRSVYIYRKLFVPFEVMHDIFGNDMKFIWYNG